MAFVIQHIPAPLTPVKEVVLYPYKATCHSYLRQTPTAQAPNPAKPLSCNKDEGNMFLEFHSRYIHQLQVSEMVSIAVSLQPYALATKFFPAEGCDWPEKPEIVVTISLSPTPINNAANHGYYNAPEKLQYRGSVSDRYKLSLVTSKVPTGYRLEMKGLEMASTDQHSYPLFCESVDGFGSGSMSALVHLRHNGRFKVFFELRLVAVKPHANVFKTTQTLAGRLISSAEETGDVILRTQAGTEVPAHSAVLSDIPYFKARFGPNWRKEPAAGERTVCLLPVEASEESLTIFRSYVYGEPHTLGAIKSHAVLQALFSLGEACDLPTLCKEVASVVKIQENDVSDWVDWLGREHLPELQPIRKQVTALVKQAVLSKKTFWEELSMEDLSHIYHATKRHKKSD